jgi:hypothetical protein
MPETGNIFNIDIDRLLLCSMQLVTLYEDGILAFFLHSLKILCL